MDAIFSLNEYENDELEILVVLPNSDSNTSKILSVYEEIKKNYKNIKFIPSLPRLDYLSFLYNCDLLIGNSSSGILEAATYKKPVINIGKRQNHRLQSKNIINVKDYNLSLIKQAIIKGISKKFLGEIKNVKNLYGTERATTKILQILNNLDLNKLNIIKEITF
jgi:GDP/UDP-N,N'-diacetylbacillosamine 2-epimerase (hydrolysing)